MSLPLRLTRLLRLNSKPSSKNCLGNICRSPTAEAIFKARASAAVCPDAYQGKIGLFLDYAPNTASREVPDPYYGGDDGFERVIAMIEKASDGLVAALKKGR